MVNFNFSAYSNFRLYGSKFHLSNLAYRILESLQSVRVPRQCFVFIYGFSTNTTFVINPRITF